MSLIGYPGGKTSSAIVPRLLGLMPAHRRYFEPFMGYGGLLLRKRPAEWDIGIDADPHAVAAVRALNQPGVLAMRGEAMAFLASAAAWLDPQDLVYLDPPYLGAVRSPDLYEHEFATDQQHTRLLQRAKQLKCRVMISGYYSAIYASLLKGWHRRHYMAPTRGGVRQEFVWMNYDPDRVALHEPARAGWTWRERERRRKKAKRWASMLRAMPPAERQMIAECLAAVELTDAQLATPRAARRTATPRVARGDGHARDPASPAASPPVTRAAALAIGGEEDRHAARVERVPTLQFIQEASHDFCA